MEFLRSCAERLDAGEGAETVMLDLRRRYTTLRCLGVKLSLVRGMCAPSAAYVAEAERRLEAEEGNGELARRVSDIVHRERGRYRASDSPRVKETIASLPDRLPPNVRALALSREEVRRCKRESARRAIEKNRVREQVDGRSLLRHAREVVRLASQQAEDDALVRSRPRWLVPTPHHSLRRLPCYGHDGGHTSTRHYVGFR